MGPKDPKRKHDTQGFADPTPHSVSLPKRPTHRKNKPGAGRKPKYDESQALALREQGKSFEEIASALGLRTAHYVEKKLAEHDFPDSASRKLMSKVDALNDNIERARIFVRELEKQTEVVLRSYRELKAASCKTPHGSGEVAYRTRSNQLDGMHNVLDCLTASVDTVTSGLLQLESGEAKQ